MISYNEIADYYIALANQVGDLITNLKLQKLVYYTQAWHLALYDKPIFEEDFQAWVHGPVLPELYNEYKNFRWNPVLRDDLDESRFSEIFKSFSKRLQTLIKNVEEEYLGLTAYQLERLTHAEDPWIKARKGLPIDEPSNNIIKKEWMQEYYKRNNAA